ncbi:MAG: hypothetical protein EZS28_023054 [Streblomastix strix]|uniref:Uncharacterized protein n=1 Tax=Streblomastix strix TaxID=222440 RepID=A0A5J4VG11_9EUKA|nr:MAG: hypothetical protein EZS28_023054 [Streblomastix strix]
MIMQYENQFLLQLFNPSTIPLVAPPYPYNQMQPYYNQQPGEFPRRGREFQGMWRGRRGRGRGGFQTNVQKRKKAFPVISHNP